MTTTVIFDVDGTLIDSTQLHAVAWARAMNSHGYNIATWRVHNAIGMGGDKIVPALLGDEVEERDGEALRASSAEEFAKIAGWATPLPGAADLVRAVKEQGLTVAIASSGSGSDVDAALKRVGIDEIVDSVTTGDDVDASKPDPDLVTVAVRATGADRAIMIGDAPYDVEAAGRIQLPCVALRTGGFSDRDLRQAGALEIFDEPKDALEFDWGSAARPPKLAD